MLNYHNTRLLRIISYFYFFVIALNPSRSFSQITERISGGIQYEASLNNWGENSPSINAVVKAISIDVDSDGNLIVAHRNSNDPFGNRIRKINRHTGIITSMAGCSSNCGNVLGGLASNYSYIDPWCISVDENNDIYFLDVYNPSNRKVYKIDAITSTISLVNGSTGIQADFISVLNGEIYYSKFTNQIYKINSSGIHELIAGNGTANFSGDNSYAPNAALNNPRDLKVQPNGDIVFIDFGNKRIRKIENGIITTIAGNGTTSPNCNSCNPLSTGFQTLINLDVDNYGNIYLIDYATIKKIDDCDGIIQNIGGNGVIGNTVGNINPLNTQIYAGGYHGMCVDHLGNINFITKGNIGGSTATNDHIYRIIPQIILDNQLGLDYHICHSDSVNVTYTGSNYFNWGYGLGINPSFQVDSSFYLTLSEYSSNGCHIVSDEIEIINIDLPIITNQFDGYTCGEGTVTIGASASQNAAVQWFDSNISNQVLSQGFNYVTPIQTSNVVYYAKAYDTIYGCESLNYFQVNALITPVDSCTFIPDDNFENKLISAGIDDQLNNFVKTSMIDTLQVLDISNTIGIPISQQISNLEGIQDFLLLKKIFATENNLDNIQLEYLYNRPYLEHYYLANNNIEYFNSNNMAGLAVLRTLEIQNNNLTCLNLKNFATNNVVNLKFFGNPYLKCIQVDEDFTYWFVNQIMNPPVDWYYSLNQVITPQNINDFNLRQFCNTDCEGVYSYYGCTDMDALNYNPYANMDDGSCQYAGLNEIYESQFVIKPNPNDGIFELLIHPSTIISEIKLLDLNGHIIYYNDSFNSNEMFDFSNLKSGVYFIQLDSNIPQRLIKL